MGLAAGIGFYGGAVIAAGVIFLTLLVLKGLEKKLGRASRDKTLFIQIENKPGRVFEICERTESYGAQISTVEITPDDKEKSRIIKLITRFPDEHSCIMAIDSIQGMEGVLKANSK